MSEADLEKLFGSDLSGLSDEEIKRRDEEMRKDAEKMCGRCYDIVDELFPANCAEKPEALLGAPIGQYHCPNCGAMVLAGVPHPTMCKLCIDRKHPEFD